MEEDKNSIFPKFSKTNIKKKKPKRHIERMYYNINMLLFSGEKDYNIKKENEFYKNSTNFFNSKNNLRISKYNKTDIEFPFIKSNKKNKKIPIKHSELCTTNNTNVIKSEENSKFHRIYKEFKKCDKKYNDITKYFKFYITSGNNNSKMYINRHIYNFKHISSVSKPKSRKYCFNAFQRVKSIQ